MTDSTSTVRKIFMMIDGHALIYRAYHAFPELTTPEGQLVNAVYGFTRILLTSIRDFEPEYIAVAFDSKEKTNRSISFEEYKANRAEMPSDLIPQIDVVKQVVDVLNIPRFEIAGFEADDLIGTLCKQVASAHDDVQNLVITGDKDLLQLVNDQTRVFIPGRGRYSVDTEYDTDVVKQKMGVRPDQIIDLKALMGDTSDNIPGVKGIGKKTAVKLMQAYETLDQLYQMVDQVNEGDPHDLLKGAVLTKLNQGKESAYLSQQLATIETQAPIQLNLPACKVSGYQKTEALELFEQLGFHSLTKLLPSDDFELGLQEALF